MHTNTIISCAAALSLAFALGGNTVPGEPAQANIPDTKEYTLSMTISDNGRIVAEPLLKIHTGAKSRIKIAQEPDASYSLDFVFSDTDDGFIAMGSTISATSPTLGTVNFEPKLNLRPGEPVRIEYGIEAPGIRPLQIEFTLTE